MIASFRFAFLLVPLAALTACGDDDTSGAGASGSTSPTGPGGGSSSGGAGGTGGGAGATGGGATGGGGMGPACDMLPAPPLQPEEALDVFNGSEDFAFDGKGRVVGKDGGSIIGSDSAGGTMSIATGVPGAFGLRYRHTGEIIVALPGDGKLIVVDAAGTSTDYITGLQTPNGVYPDFDGNVWVTEMGAGNVLRINPDQTTDAIVQGGSEGSGANGIVYDADRQLLFFTNYGPGKIRKVDMSGADMTAVEIADIQGAALDGLVLDACGNIYAVDNGNDAIYRVKLDVMGNALGPAEKLADFPQNVANAQFGSGMGFDPTKLYVTGNPGTLYAIAAGVPGKPVPTAP